MSDPAGFPPNLLLDYVTEAEWQRQVEEMAARLGWLYHHETDSRKSAAGAPDLMLAHPVHGPAWFECKRQKKPSPYTPTQRHWIATLQASGQVAAVIQPSDGDWVEAVLRGQTRDIPEHRREHLTTG